VLSSVTYTLSSNVENLTLTGTTAINGTGNALNNALIGNSAANALSGGTGHDTLEGMEGPDTLIGGNGNDTYLVGVGYGSDTVVENDATSGNSDVARFLSGATADQIWFRHVGNNLEASIIGTDDRLMIQDWYLGSAYRVEEFKTSDGNMTLLSSQVENLVSAMASFAPPAAGETALPTHYQDALASVIAANWQ
jgi:Ca2+-binding RTX toxin-like protein